MMPRLAWMLVFVMAGCNGLDIRSQSPETSDEEAGGSTRLIGDMTVPFGLYPVQAESVALVTNLPGTGSNPAPSPERAELIEDMQRRGVINPNQVLASPTTDLVLVQGWLRPGIQKGDRFDIEVRVQSRSENRGLRGGWLMSTRLRQLAVLGGSLHEGSLMALAEGAILVDPSAETGDIERSRGRVLGGGVSLIDRELGLVIRPGYQNVLYSQRIGDAINRRFHSFTQGVQEGVAKPKTEDFITLAVHPRYKDNIERYMRVIRALPLSEAPRQEAARLKLLERQLLDPITASSASIRLEALGNKGTPILLKGLESPEAEVRFYSAEALAYLDESAAAEPLGVLARDVPAFRAFALAALSAMDDYSAYDALVALLPSPSAETRYGAFRALWAMNPNDALVRGEQANDQFSYHVLDVEGPPMIHFTRSYRAELVLFGAEQRFSTPLLLDAGAEILVKSIDDEHVSVTRFAVDQRDEKRVVSPRVDDVIRAIIELGGSYPDVVQALQQAKAENKLASRLEIDAIPKAGRRYWRDGADEPATEGEGQPPAEQDPLDQVAVSTPLSELFAPPQTADEGVVRASYETEAPPEKPGPVRAFFGKMMGREE